MLLVFDNLSGKELGKAAAVCRAWHVIIHKTPHYKVERVLSLAGRLRPMFVKIPNSVKFIFANKLGTAKQKEALEEILFKICTSEKIELKEMRPVSELLQISPSQPFTERVTKYYKDKEQIQPSTQNTLKYSQLLYLQEKVELSNQLIGNVDGDGTSDFLAEVRYERALIALDRNGPEAAIAEIGAISDPELQNSKLLLLLKKSKMLKDDYPWRLHNRFFGCAEYLLCLADIMRSEQEDSRVLELVNRAKEIANPHDMARLAGLYISIGESALAKETIEQITGVNERNLNRIRYAANFPEDEQSLTYQNHVVRYVQETIARGGEDDLEVLECVVSELFHYLLSRDHRSQIVIDLLSNPCPSEFKEFLQKEAALYDLYSGRETRFSVDAGQLRNPNMRLSLIAETYRTGKMPTVEVFDKLRDINIRNEYWISSLAVEMSERGEFGSAFRILERSLEKGAAPEVIDRFATKVLGLLPATTEEEQLALLPLEVDTAEEPLSPMDQKPDLLCDEVLDD